MTFLYCADLAAADAFYRDLLGLSLALDQGACRIYRVAPAAFLGFCRTTANLSPGDSAGLILTFVVDDRRRVDEWFQYLVARGAGDRIEKPPEWNATFNIYHLILRDPAGYLVEIQSFLGSEWPGRDPKKGEF